MEENFMGVYWKNRTSTLRQHATYSVELLRLLGNAHPAFAQWYWVGNRLGAEVKLQPDLSNVEDLIYRHAATAGSTYDLTRPDGGPAWEASSSGGYRMWYVNGRAPEGGGITLSISTGKIGGAVSNNSVLGFPVPGDTGFTYKEFGDYSFLKTLFLVMIEHSQPDCGLVTSHSFSRMVIHQGGPDAGWLTYVKDPRAQALRNDTAFSSLLMENAPFGGTLFSLGTEQLSASDAGQIILARRLREKLISEGLLGL